MDNLLVRNLVHRSMTVETQKVVRVDRDVRFSNLTVRIKEGKVFVHADLIAAPGTLSQSDVDSVRDNISKTIAKPVILEFSIIPEKIMRSSDTRETSR